MYLPFTFKPPNISSLSKTIMLNINMYVLTILTCSLKIKVTQKIYFSKDKPL